jgi:hypothetical protein
MVWTQSARSRMFGTHRAIEVVFEVVPAADGCAAVDRASVAADLAAHPGLEQHSGHPHAGGVHPEGLQPDTPSDIQQGQTLLAGAGPHH